MASLRSTSGIHFCGGTIVSNRYILTSAQCTIRRAANAINIELGTVQRLANGVSYVSSNIIIHPAFDRKTLANE